MDTGYAVGGSTSFSGGGADSKGESYWPLSRCKKAYLDYLGNKTEEIKEQKDARRYYHGAQWTNEQLKVLKKRRQPPSTKNRIARKIDGTVGLLGRLKQDPKAFPRTKEGEQGAELATAVIRYLLDAQEWEAKDPECGRDCAVDGFGGIEILIEPGDHGDPDVGFDIVEPDSFFYDPRSYRGDFSDAGYMGQGKWVEIETAKEMFPDKAGEISGLAEDGSELSSNPDREQKWFSFDGAKKLVRLIDLWYRHNGGWCYAIFTGSVILMEDKSYLKDEKGKAACKYIMFSCNVDHDGDRYGFVRHMKSSQDSFNFKHSKLNHILASRRLIMSQGSVQDIEKARAEWARDDGVVLVNGNVNESIKADDRTFDFAGWAKLLEEDKAELDNFGPNPALIGDLTNQSGRAIQLLQQAGMAELGPYILGYRGWKIRVYRALFSAAQTHWQSERWIRVTDDQEVAQFIQINGTGVGPDGFPTMVNAIGSLDVDIIMDEGPDTINAQQDVYETLSNVLPTIGPMLSPPIASAAVEILMDNSALPASSKKKFRDASSRPDPMAEQAKQIQLAGEAAKVDETKSKVALNMAKAQEAATPEMGAPQQPQPEELPMEVQIAQAVAEIVERHASAKQKDAAAYKATVEAQLAPQKAAEEAELKRQNFQHQAQMDRANFKQGAKDKQEDRKIAAKQKAKA